MITPSRIHVCRTSIVIPLRKPGTVAVFGPRAKAPDRNELRNG